MTVDQHNHYAFRRSNVTALLTFAKSNVEKSNASEGDDVFQNLWLGCTIAALSNVVIAAGLNVQKYTHMKLSSIQQQQQQQQAEADVLTPLSPSNPPRVPAGASISVVAAEQANASTVSLKYYTYPLWWLGIALLIMGEMGNFVAYGVAPASAIAPLGITCVIANVGIARVFLKEVLRASTLIGSCIGVSGAVLLVLFIAKENDTIFDPRGVEIAVTQPSFVLYLTGLAVALVVLFLLLYIQHQKSLLIMLFIANILASITVISAKAVSGFVVLFLRGTLSLLGLITQPVLYFLVLCVVITGITQVKYVQDALAIYPATFVVPVNYILFTLSAITAGIIFYGELLGLGEINVIIFIIGCVLCFAGVFLITDDGRAFAAMSQAAHGCIISGNSALEMTPTTYGGTAQVTATSTAGPATGPNTGSAGGGNRVVTLLRDCVKNTQSKFELHPLLHSSPAPSQQEEKDVDIEAMEPQQNSIINEEKMMASSQMMGVEPSPISKHIISMTGSGMKSGLGDGGNIKTSFAMMSPANHGGVSLLIGEALGEQVPPRKPGKEAEYTVIVDGGAENRAKNGNKEGSPTPTATTGTGSTDDGDSPKPVVETLENVSVIEVPSLIVTSNEGDSEGEGDGEAAKQVENSLDQNKDQN